MKFAAVAAILSAMPLLASAGFVSSNFTCNSTNVASATAKCASGCAVDLVPYSECSTSREQFSCYCISAAKAECFGECFGTPNNRTSVSRSYCKKNCTINGDDESAATDPSTGAASTMETAAGVALASMVAGVFMML